MLKDLFLPRYFLLKNHLYIHMLLKIRKIGNSYHLLLPMTIARQFLSRGFVNVIIDEEEVREEEDNEE